MDGHRCVNNLLHALTDTAGILQCHGMSDVQVHIVTIAHRDIDSHLARRVQVAYGLTKDEKQGARVGTLARCRGDIEEFHAFGFVDAIVHSFHLVIYMCEDRLVLHGEIHQLQSLTEVTSHGDIIVLPIVQTGYFYCFFHILYCFICIFFIRFRA